VSVIVVSQLHVIYRCLNLQHKCEVENRIIMLRCIVAY